MPGSKPRSRTWLATAAASPTASDALRTSTTYRSGISPVSGGGGFGASSAASAAACCSLIALSTKSCTSPSSTSTTSPRSFVSGPRVGMVRKRRLPAAMSDACRANASRSQSASMTSADCSTSISPASLVGSVRVWLDSTLSATAARKTCWRRIRERSPSGSPCRCRTKDSAAAPEIVCGPAAKRAPDSGSFTGAFRHTSTPPIVVVRVWKPYRLTSA